MLSVGIEGQQPRGPLLDETDARVSMAVHAALVAFGLSEPGFQVEVVLRPVGLGIPDKAPGLAARPHLAPVLPGRGSAPVPLVLSRLKLGLTLVTRATGRIEGSVERPPLRPLVLHLLLSGLHPAPPPVDGAGSTGASLLRRPPFCASRCRWSDARPSPRASAIRMPGGCHGPPCSSLRMPRGAVQSSRTTSRASASGSVSAGGISAPGTAPQLSAGARVEVGRTVRCSASTARSMARHPRMARRICTVARRSASNTGWATSRRT
jgi:hypothetical protein